MIIQTAPAGEPRLAIMMHEHTALSGQFARAFGNDRFEPTEPNDLMFHVVSHHDEGWAEFDRDPATDEKKPGQHHGNGSRSSVLRQYRQSGNAFAWSRDSAGLRTLGVPDFE